MKMQSAIYLKIMTKIRTPFSLTRFWSEALSGDLFHELPTVWLMNRKYLKEHGLSKTNDIAAAIELSPARTRVLLKEMSDVSLLRQADEPDQRTDLGRQQIFVVT